MDAYKMVARCIRHQQQPVPAETMSAVISAGLAQRGYEPAPAGETLPDDAARKMAKRWARKMAKRWARRIWIEMPHEIYWNKFMGENN